MKCPIEYWQIIWWIFAFSLADSGEDLTHQLDHQYNWEMPMESTKVLIFHGWKQLWHFWISGRPEEFNNRTEAID